MSIASLYQLYTKSMVCSSDIGVTLVLHLSYIGVEWGEGGVVWLWCGYCVGCNIMLFLALWLNNNGYRYGKKER